MLQSMNPLSEYKRILGKYCAINQFIELSNRCFVNEHAREIEDSLLLKDLSKTHKLNLSVYNANRMYTEIYRSYIVNVHLCFETFLISMISYIKDFGSKKFVSRNTEESYLACLITNIYGENRPIEVEKKFRLCEYYRLVRNSAVHDLVNINTHKAEFSALKKYSYDLNVSNYTEQDGVKEYRQLRAPNSYDRINYDDFLLFSKTTVELATKIFADFSYDYKKVIDSIPQKLLTRWSIYTDERLGNALREYVKTYHRYGLVKGNDKQVVKEKKKRYDEDFEEKFSDLLEYLKHTITEC